MYHMSVFAVFVIVDTTCVHVEEFRVLIKLIIQESRSLLVISGSGFLFRFGWHLRLISTHTARSFIRLNRDLSGLNFKPVRAYYIISNTHLKIRMGNSKITKIKFVCSLLLQYCCKKHRCIQFSFV